MHQPGRILYLHGFASSPQSRKAQFFRERFAARGRSLEIPDLAPEGFERLTISGQLGVVEREARGEPVALIGSSLGGYIAALYAARRPEVTRLVLLAPALCFARRWRERLGAEQLELWRRQGWIEMYHYGVGDEQRLGYQFALDAPRFEAYPRFTQPALILHGIQDDVVPPRSSLDFAAAHPNVSLCLVESDHELGDVMDFLWEETSAFLAS